MKPHLLSNALDECLPKILHILDVTLTKLLLHMDAEVLAQKSKNPTEQPLKKIKIEADDTNKMDTSDSSVELNTEEENNEKFEKRLRLAHAIMDLLNTMEAGSKSSVIRTTEVRISIFIKKILKLNQIFADFKIIGS